MLWGLVGIGAGVLLLGAVPHIAAALAATFIIGFAFARDHGAGADADPARDAARHARPRRQHNASVIFLGQILGLAARASSPSSSACAMVFFLCAALSVALAVGGRVFLEHARAHVNAPAVGGCRRLTVIFGTNVPPDITV